MARYPDVFVRQLSMDDGRMPQRPHGHRLTLDRFGLPGDERGCESDRQVRFPAAGFTPLWTETGTENMDTEKFLGEGRGGAGSSEMR